MITISERANEQSTIIFTVALTDEDDGAVTPNTLVWSLTDAAGTVINERDQVAVAAPATSNDIMLFGDDLQILDSEALKSAVNRRLIIEATYDSDAGSDLPAIEVAAFVVENFVKVA